MAAIFTRYCELNYSVNNDQVPVKQSSKRGLIDQIVQGKVEFPTDADKVNLLNYLTNVQVKEKKHWKCPLCPELVFDRKHDQVVHIKEVHGVIKPFECKYCDRKFPVSFTSLMI